MLQIKYLANLFLIIFLVLFLNFLYVGIITKQPVSPDYNIPIAKSILNGTIISLPGKDVFLYFPGSSHVILSFFLLIGFPNLFGLLSWVCLFIVCKKVADTFGLTRYMSVIFATSFCTTISVIRTVGDQSIDKWLCVWFLISLILLEKMKWTWRNSILLGLSLGMLFGTKYSGPLFFIALLSVYGKRLFIDFKLIRLSVAFVLFALTGLFWYIRNIILKGNPYYPANLPFLKGYPHYTQQDWMLWKVIFFYPQGIRDLINAFFSEYIFWAFAGIVVLFYLLNLYRKKQKIDGRILRLGMLGVTTALVSLLLPITTPYKVPLFHTISDMRYIYIDVCVVLLALFLLAEKYKKNIQIGTIAFLNTLPAFSFVPYMPKLFLLSLLVIIAFYFKGQKILEKIYNI